MSIQANLNQMLSLAGLLASQTPAAHARKAEKEVEVAEKQKFKDLEREEQSLKLQLEHTDPMEVYADTIRGVDVFESVEEEAELVDKLGDVAKRKFEHRPSQESYGEYLEAKYKTAEEYDTPEKAGERAMMREMAKDVSLRDKAKAQAELAAKARAEELAKSRAFAQMVTEGSMPSYGVREVIKYGQK